MKNFCVSLAQVLRSKIENNINGNYYGNHSKFVRVEGCKVLSEPWKDA